MTSNQLKYFQCPSKRGKKLSNFLLCTGNIVFMIDIEKDRLCIFKWDKLYDSVGASQTPSSYTHILLSCAVVEFFPRKEEKLLLLSQMINTMKCQAEIFRGFKEEQKGKKPIPKNFPHQCQLQIYKCRENTNSQRAIAREKLLCFQFFYYHTRLAKAFSQIIKL